MSSIHLSVITSIIMLLALIGLAMMLRRVGVLEQGAHLFSELVTKVTLPALIFTSLAHDEIAWREMELAVAMAGVSIVCLFLGWLFASLMRLDAPRRGAVLLVSGFGSSSLLGFALIAKVFPGDGEALGEAAILSGLGVQPLLFTLGTMIAMYYGRSGMRKGQQWNALWAYLKSPIFLAFVSGLLYGALRGPAAHPVFDSILDGIGVAGAANTLLVTLAVGLLLRLDGLRQVLLLVAGVCLIKLIASPHCWRYPPAWSPTLRGKLKCSCWKGPCPRPCYRWSFAVPTAATPSSPQSWFWPPAPCPS